VPLIYVTGNSGAGKSSVRDELRRRLRVLVLVNLALELR
jgi:hypothetical protein